MINSTRVRPTSTQYRAHVLGHASVRGIGISSQYIFDACQNMAAEDTRAVKWFVGFARLLNRNADSFQAELGMDAVQIRQCLTAYTVDATLRAQFTGAVAMLREHWEKRLSEPYSVHGNPFAHQTPFHHALGNLARTQPVTETRKAVSFAETGGWAVTEGLERMGKTVAGANAFLHRLDAAAWCRVPSGSSLRSFLIEIGRAVGVHTHNNNEVTARLTARIADVLGPGKIETLFLDQFHAVLPVNPTRTYPARLEQLMDWLDGLGVNIVGIATPQWRGQMEFLGSNPNYRIGQVIGRIRTFRLRETLTVDELKAVAKSRQPDLSDTAANLLAAQARNSSGYCGTLMNTLSRFRQIYADLDERPRGMADEAWQVKAVALAINEEEQFVKGGK